VKSWWIPAFVAAMVVLGLAVLGGVVWSSRARPVPFADFSIARLTNAGNVRLVAASPDGRYLLTVHSDKGQESLRLRNLPTNSMAQVMPPDPRRYANLSFSPDGNYIFFERERELYRAPVLGGTPQRLLTAVDSGITFSPDAQRIAFTRDIGGVSELVVARADGSGERTIATSHEILWRTAAWSPKEDVIVAAAFRPDSSLEELVSVTVADGNERVLASSDQLTFTNAAWMPDGRSLVVTYGDKATGFHRLQVGSVEFPSGEVRPITRDVNSYDSLSVSGDGESIAAVVKQGGYDAYVMSVDGSGTARALSSHQDLNFVAWESDSTLLTDDGARVLRVATSGDAGDTVVYEDRQHPFVTGAMSCGPSAIAFTAVGAGKDSNVWLMQRTDSGLKQLTNGINNFAQFCSPDGQWVYYLDETTHALNRVSVQGGGTEKLAGPKQNSIAGSSPDGSLLARFVTTAGGAELLIQNASTGHTEKQMKPDARVATAPHAPRFLPDGRSVAYIVSDRGVDNIVVQPLDGGTPRQLTRFASDRIRDFAFSPHGDQIAMVRGHFDSDAVLLQQAKR
jgi:Tol biopolymer transport system component